MGNSRTGKGKRAGGKRARSRAGSAEKRLAKKLDAMCLLISGAVIAVTAWLEYRDRRRNGPRPLR